LVIEIFQKIEKMIQKILAISLLLPYFLPAQKTWTTQFDYEPDLVFVEGGTFTMGCTDEQGSDCFDNEKPAYEVTLPGFYMAKHEVTQTQWKAVMGTTPSYFKDCDQCPVEQVSWDDIQEFLDGN